MSLKEFLDDWTDYPFAAYYLSVCFGIMKYDGSLRYYGKAKAVFNIKHPLGDFLYLTLEEMAKLGILETSDEGYRWNKNYKGYWDDEIEDGPKTGQQ